MATLREEALKEGCRLVAELVDTHQVSAADFEAWFRNQDRTVLLADTIKRRPGGLVNVRREIDGMYGSRWICERV